jgi:hypothetical protein
VGLPHVAKPHSERLEEVVVEGILAVVVEVDARVGQGHPGVPDPREVIVPRRSM